MITRSVSSSTNQQHNAQRLKQTINPDKLLWGNSSSTNQRQNSEPTKQKFNPERGFNELYDKVLDLFNLVSNAGQNPHEETRYNL